MVEAGRGPADMGFLPYAVIEGTERLALCFAEHRRWPDHAAVREKCLVYGGAARALRRRSRAAAPHHDPSRRLGRLPAGRSPSRPASTAAIDALFERVPFDAPEAVAGLAPAPFADLRSGVLAELAASHARLDAAYRLEPALAAEAGRADPAVVAFTCERYRATALFLARLFATAWADSERLELPSWLLRESGALEPARSPL